ncbi:WG repeat-containing protein [Uliginosibacterium sp. 31-16]|uniref:WG repeat-containing protein n=1 Tax=Uliginosibacterium sp. 31-16 TaxID=3068315 RepID=UPI00273FC3A8|nr:WG repeat-containing protein [Uliginosibacterium sp. 31-16]MDP5238946.1 WG repeat-containing protein [Uliginosibacterium sp. 31-16]
MKPMCHAKRCASVFLLCMAAFLNPGLARAATAADFPGLRVERSPVGEGRLRMLSARTGAVIFDKLEAAYPYDGYVTVSRDLHYGVVDAEGRVLLPLEFERIEFHAACDCFEVKRKGQTGLLTRAGKPLLPLTYEFIQDDEQPGLWVVRAKTGYGAIDPRSGKIVLPAVYKEMQKRGSFIIAGNESQRRGEAMVWQAWDSTGRPVPGLQRAGGLNILDKTDLLLVDGRRVIDVQGRERIPAGRYDYLMEAGERLITVLKDRYGLIDATGKEIIPPRYQHLGYFNSNPFWLQATLFGPDGEAGHIGVVDADGKVVIDPQWDSADLDYSRAREGKPASGFFLVERNRRYGVFGLDGRLLFPARFEKHHSIDRDSPLHLVTLDGLRGLCDFTTGKCPLPVQYEVLGVLDRIGNGEELFIAGKPGALGVVDIEGRPVLPPAFGSILEDSYTGVITSGAKGVQPYRFERDAAGRWQASAEKTIPLAELPWDRHPLASETHPLIEARYVPEQYQTEAQVLAGVEALKLRDAQFPSIQLSAQAAYVQFGEFVSPRIPLWRNTLPWCRTPDGWRVVVDTSVERDAKDVCADATLSALHFRGDPDKRLLCADCARYDLPEVWVRQDRAAPGQCKAGAWNAAQARADYASWLSAWRTTWQAAVKSPKTITRSTLGVSVAPVSRATVALGQILLEPENLQVPLPAGIEAVAPEHLAARLDALFAEAQPVGYGGLYPEPEARFAGLCAEVWYLRLPSLEVRLAAGQPSPLGSATSYALPAEGTLRRDAYPFILVSREGGTLRLAGLSKEWVQVLRAK